MNTYKELSFEGDKSVLDEFKRLAPSFANGDWKYEKTEGLSDYIMFAYYGKKAKQAEVSIYYGENSWREGFIRVGNIVPLGESSLTITEYNEVLDLFYKEIIEPNQRKIQNLVILFSKSDEFNPLECISEKALKKLEAFCNNANKNTGASHPCDEERWFDFICQTVDDQRTFDYDTLSKFLMDEEYWGKRPSDGAESMGRFAWDERHAGDLALEYDSFVRILQHYNDWKQRA